MPTRLSGLQKQVFSIYRRLLREAIKKDHQRVAATGTNATEPGTPAGSVVPQRLVELLRQPSTVSSYAKAEFRRQASSVKRNDFSKIEYMIRTGEKHLRMLKMPGVDWVSGSANLGGSSSSSSSSSSQEL
jgi:hypothetical protein